MAKRDDAPEILRKGDEVICAAELREVPAGTPGKVVLVVGLSWIRYWVSFSNGVAVGSINRKALATPAEWERRHDVVDAVGATDDGGEAAAGADDGGGGGYTHAGVLVPQLLIDRAKAARERLGA